jgi:hypothetical protein
VWASLPGERTAEFVRYNRGKCVSPLYLLGVLVPRRGNWTGEPDKMKTALYLLGFQGLIGAFDTLFYHEWKAQLPARGRRAAPELALHAARDFLYGVLFCTLPWLAWKGTWTIVLLGVITAEIILTLWDFVVEITVRKDLGDVYAGERVTHAVMGIAYGAMLASLAPTLNSWWGSPTGLTIEPATIPEWMRIIVSAMGVGVVGSGLRDLYAALGLPGGGWPWGTNKM